MRRILGLILIVFCVNVSFAQMNFSTTPPYNTVNHLINNVFSDGSVQITNINSVGVSSQFGYFSNGMNAVGLDSGVVMATDAIGGFGICNSCGGPAAPNPPAALPGFPWMSGNLVQTSTSVPALIGESFNGAQSINNRAAISFDFVPQQDTMRFEFVFASEEWDTWPCSQYNDVFGFYVAGPGINGPYGAPPGFANAQNFALVPGTNIPITISSITSPTSPGFCGQSHNSQYYVNGVGNAGLNAKTTVLEIVFPVQRCQTYNFTMAIANGTDQGLQSAVFMAGNSFGTTSPFTANIEPSYTELGGDSVLYEGCGGGDLTFTRNDSALLADSIPLVISGSATNGVDYTTLPDTAYFAQGQDSLTLPFDVFNDGIIEGDETLKIFINDTTVQLSCSSNTGDTLELIIRDPVDLNRESITNDTIICTDQNIPVEFQPDTGLFPLTYQWSNGDTNSSFVVPSIIQDTNFIVTVTDACGIDTLIDTARVIVDNPPTSIETPGDTIDCESPGTQVEVFTNDPMPGLQYSWSNNQTTTSFYQNNPYITTNYVVTVTQNCANYFLTDTFTLFVDNPPFTLETQDDTINCTDPPVTIGPEVSYTTPNFSFQWGNGSQDSSITVQPTSSTTYVVSVTDACGYRTVTDSITVYVDNDPIITSTENELINCVGDSADMEVQVQGGYPPYSIQWSSGGTDSIETVAGTSGTQTYTVSVTDVCQLNTVTEQVNVVVRDYEDLQIAPLQNETLLCKGDQFEIGPAQVLGGSGDNVVSWNNWDDETNLAWGVTDTNITFTVRAADLCNLDSTQTTVQIIVPDYDPMDLTTTNDTFICPSDEVTIGALATGGAENEGYEYNWGNGKTGDQILVSPNQSRTYYVTATDVCGHEAYAEVFVESSAPTADFEFEFIDPFNVMFENKSTLADSFSWNFGDGNTDSFKDPMHQYEEDVTHNVTLKAINEYGCYDTTTKELNPPLVAFIPNAFTPNGDGLNDVFELNGGGIRSSENIQKFNIAIFDRWGTEIFFSNDPNFKWDGIDQNNGQKVSVGVYPFKLTIEGYGTQKIEMTGSITIPSVD